MPPGRRRAPRLRRRRGRRAGDPAARAFPHGRGALRRRGGRCGPGRCRWCPQVAASPDGRVVAAAAWVGPGPRAQVRVVVEGEAPVTLAEPKDGVVGGAGGPRDRGRGRRRRRGGLARAGGRRRQLDARARPLPRGAAPARAVRSARSSQLGAVRRVAGETGLRARRRRRRGRGGDGRARRKGDDEVRHHRWTRSRPPHATPRSGRRSASAPTRAPSCDRRWR